MFDHGDDAAGDSADDGEYHAVHCDELQRDARDAHGARRADDQARAMTGSHGEAMHEQTGQEQEVKGGRFPTVSSPKHANGVGGDEHVKVSVSRGLFKGERDLAPAASSAQHQAAQQHKRHTPDSGACDPWCGGVGPSPLNSPPSFAPSPAKSVARTHKAQVPDKIADDADVVCDADRLRLELNPLGQRISSHLNAFYSADEFAAKSGQLIGAMRDETKAVVDRFHVLQRAVDKMTFTTRKKQRCAEIARTALEQIKAIAAEEFPEPDDGTTDQPGEQRSLEDDEHDHAGILACAPTQQL